MSCYKESRYKEDYESLRLQYLTPNSLMYKKLRIVDSFINEGDRLLDIGAGTGDLIELERQKFNEIYGIDTDEDSIRICSERFENNKNIIIKQSGIDSLKDLFHKALRKSFVEKVQQFSFCAIIRAKREGPALALLHFVALC